MNSLTPPRFPEIGAAIIAGGMGARMGGTAKAFLDLGGEAILDRQLSVLKPRFGELIAAVGPEGPQTGAAAAFARRGMNVVTDLYPSAGPLAGLHAALEASRKEWLFAFACDMPFLDGVLIDRMAGLALQDGSSEALIPARKGRPEPLHALYRPWLAAEAATCLRVGRRAMIDLLAGVSTRLLKEDDLPGMTQSYAWTNLNTPADLQAAALALTRAGAGRGGEEA